MNRWTWVVKNAVAICLALLIGSILGSISFFQGTSLGSTRLSAADLVQFLGYGCALLLTWVAARRAVKELPETGAGLSFLRETVLPLATLVVVAASYPVLLLVLNPFLGMDAMTIYRWIFVIGIIAAAGWLIFACYDNAGTLLSTLGTAPASRAVVEKCLSCGTMVAAAAKYCPNCGQPATSKKAVSAMGRCACGAKLIAGSKFCDACGKPVAGGTNQPQA